MRAWAESVQSLYRPVLGMAGWISLAGGGGYKHVTAPSQAKGRQKKVKTAHSLPPPPALPGRRCVKMLLLRRLASVAAVSGGIFGRINAAQGPGVTHATSAYLRNHCFLSTFVS